jgi:hypothetical protein
MQGRGLPRPSCFQQFVATPNASQKFVLRMIEKQVRNYLNYKYKKNMRR